MYGEIGFKSPGKFAAGEHNVSPTAFTFKAYIRAEACNSPFIRSAWMLFAQAQVIVEAKIGKHQQAL